LTCQDGSPGRRRLRHRRCRAAQSPVDTRPARAARPSPGAQFHSAQWDHSIRLGGKAHRRHRQCRAAPCSSCRRSRRSRQSSRSSSARQTGLLPRKDRLYAARTQRLLTRFPALAKLYHDMQWFVFGEIATHPAHEAGKARTGDRTLEVAAPPQAPVRDPALRAKLLPRLPDRREARAVQRRLFTPPSRDRTCASSPTASNASSLTAWRSRTGRTARRRRADSTQQASRARIPRAP